MNMQTTLSYLNALRTQWRRYRGSGDVLGHYSWIEGVIAGIGFAIDRVKLEEQPKIKHRRK